MPDKPDRHDKTSDRIVSVQMIADFIRDNQSIRIVRSGVYGVLGHCAEVIADVCKQSTERKEIRIILPSLTNHDVVARAESAGFEGRELLERLANWHEIIAETGQSLPEHSIQLHTTELPHRYHAFFSDSEGIVGIAWHHRALLTTTSFDVRRTSRFRKWVLGNLIEDFDWHWANSHLYQPGDNKKRLKAGPVPAPLDPLLQGFGKAIPNVIKTLKCLKTFPDENGNGATKENLARHCMMDPSDCNKLMLRLECAGMVRKLSGGELKAHGRLLTDFGRRVLEQWEQSHR